MLNPFDLATARIQLYLFGSFELLSDHRRISLPTRKMESLLAYLVLHPERHAREKLAVLCWGEFREAKARHSLSHALTTLRHQLQDQLLLADRTTVQLNPDYPLWVDTREFLEFPAQISFLSPPDMARLQRQIALYRGDLLNNFYDDWILLEREHYRNFYVDALLRLTQQMRTQSEYARAIELAQMVLQVDSAHERAHQHLMFAYVASGERAAALKQYDVCERCLRSELEVEPAPETVALAQWIRRVPLSAEALSAALTNLPIPLSSFIGRQRETAAVKALLTTGGAPHSLDSERQGSQRGVARLVTLTGSGGSGKTRLAIHVATDLVDSYHDGVWWVDLSSLLNGEGVVMQAVAKTLGVREAPNQSLLETVAQFLQNRQVLLVMDNCEHLVDACAELTHTLLSRCPQLQILATSRELLEIPGECVYPVPTLSLPDPYVASLTELLLQYEAICLFVERCQAHAASFELNEGNAAAVLQICRRLDGIPLAIELASARMRVLSVAQIAARLDDRLNLLAASSQRGPPRQQTLRATIDWSYDLLSDAERILLRRLSVFAGSFTFEAVEQVCGPLASLLDLMSQLVDKSLVLVERNGDEVEYRLLETLREYAWEKLLAASEEAQLRANHLLFFIQWAEAAEPKLRGTEQVRWLALFERSHDNVRVALSWAIERNKGVEALRLSATIANFWEEGGYWSEGRQWLKQALALSYQAGLSSSTPSIVRNWYARTLLHAGNLASRQSDFANARDLLDESLALYRELDNQNGLADVLAILAGVAFEQGEYPAALALHDEWLTIRREMGYDEQSGVSRFNRGLIALNQGEYAAARTHLEESLKQSRESSNTLGISYALNTLGNVVYLQGEYGKALALYQESLALRRELGYKPGVAATLNDMANVMIKQEDLVTARALYKESLTLFRELGNRRGMIRTLSGLARIHQAESHIQLAVKLLSAVEALLLALKARLDEPEHSDKERAIGLLRTQLDETSFHKAWEEGYSLTLEQALTMARQTP